MEITKYFLMFIFYAFIGWSIEVINMYVKEKRYINRGFLIGPYCPIYGVGALLSIILLKRYTNDPIALFCMSIVIFSILEYMTSYVLEKIFKARWWDYSENKYNINGRICLETMIPFGILGLILIYLINPFFNTILDNIDNNILIVLSIIIVILYVIDTIISFTAIFKLRIKTVLKEVDNTEEITKHVKEYLNQLSKKGRDIVKTFPTLKVYKRIKEIRESKK